MQVYFYSIKFEIKTKKRFLYSKDKIYVIGVVPVLVTFAFEVALSAELTFPDFNIGFYTGFGPFKVEYGAEVDNNGDFEAYKIEDIPGSLDDLIPAFDFVFGIGGNKSCLNIGFTPQLSFTPSVSLYKVIKFGLEFAFSLPMTEETSFKKKNEIILHFEF